jgi:hypothetical protein
MPAATTWWSASFRIGEERVGNVEGQQEEAGARDGWMGGPVRHALPAGFLQVLIVYC